MKIIKTRTTDVFQSKHTSTCSICTQKITVGDNVRYLDGKLRHQDCKNQNKLDMRQERKKVNPSFLAKYSGTCATCHQPYEEGDRIRYNPDEQLVHHRHEKEEKICTQCWLVLPCECA